MAVLCITSGYLSLAIHIFVTCKRPQKVSLISMKFGVQVEVDEWCTTVCSTTWSKVKVMSPSKLETRPFSKAISFAIYNGSWQLTTDFYTRAQYLNLIGPDCDIWLSFCVTWLWSRQKRQFWRVDRQSCTGLIFLCIWMTSCTVFSLYVYSLIYRSRRLTHQVCFQVLFAVWV